MLPTYVMCIGQSMRLILNDGYGYFSVILTAMHVIFTENFPVNHKPIIITITMMMTMMIIIIIIIIINNNN